MTRACLLALALCLAGCDWSAAPAGRGGEASGEVLPGTASDAMIPLGELKSQAPLAPRQPTPEDAAAAAELDAEQPVVTPAEGIDGGPGAPAPAGPGPATPP
jgi:hypothetical protein